MDFLSENIKQTTTKWHVSPWRLHWCGQSPLSVVAWVPSYVTAQDPTPLHCHSDSPETSVHAVGPASPSVQLYCYRLYKNTPQLPCSAIPGVFLHAVGQSAIAVNRDAFAQNQEVQVVTLLFSHPWCNQCAFLCSQPSWWSAWENTVQKDCLSALLRTIRYCRSSTELTLISGFHPTAGTFWIVTIFFFISFSFSSSLKIIIQMLKNPKQQVKHARLFWPAPGFSSAGVTIISALNCSSRLQRKCREDLKKGSWKNREDGN